MKERPGGGSENTGRTAARFGDDDDASEDNTSGGGDAVITCEPLDMLVILLCCMSCEFNVPVLGEAPTDTVRQLVDLQQWKQRMALMKFQIRGPTGLSPLSVHEFGTIYRQI